MRIAHDLVKLSTANIYIHTYVHMLYSKDVITKFKIAVGHISNEINHVTT